MSCRSLVSRICGPVAARSIPLIAVFTFACGDGSTEPNIPFPMPDLTGTWSIAFSAPGGVFGDGMASGPAVGATFTGRVEMRLVQSEGFVSGEYSVGGDVVTLSGKSVESVMREVFSDGQMVDGRMSWDIHENCGPSEAWCFCGELRTVDEANSGMVRATVEQRHVESPTQLEVKAFRFYIDNPADTTLAFMFEGVGTATRLK